MKNSPECSPTHNTHEQLVTDTYHWEQLRYDAWNTPHLRELLDDPNRREILPVLQAGDIYADFIHQRVDQVDLKSLFEFSRERNIEGQIADMFHGAKVNKSEGRAALHIALRALETDEIFVDGINVVPEVYKVRRKMEAFATQIHSGEWRGATGKKIKHVIVFGIGGSNLGPEMACKALEQYRQEGIEVHFVANVDPNDINQFIRPLNGEEGLNPEETLCVVESKTFTTTETMQNANIARKWVVDHMGEEAVSKHFVAVSTNKEAVEAFGIDSNNMFEMWDWVGGRYSVTSAIGLPVMLSVGVDHFNEFLEGARVIDEHYRTAPLEQNIPLCMAAFAIWNNNFMRIPTHGVFAYHEQLELLALHFQQLSMESLGKRVTQDGHDLGIDANAYLMPGTGTNVQHSWMQQVQMGAETAIDFIALLQPQYEDDIDQHNSLLSNMVAQAVVMARGVTEQELRDKHTPEALIPHKIMPGNRPSTIIFAEKLTPGVLGQLLALYEHATHAQAALLGINAFDQWAVEAAKILAKMLSERTARGVALTPETFPQMVWQTRHQ